MIRRGALDQDEKSQIITYLQIEPQYRSLSSLKFLSSIFQRRIGFFRDLKAQMNSIAIQRVINCLRLEYANPYQVLFNQGDIGHKMYIILKGEVAILAKTGDFTKDDYQQKRIAIKSFDDLIQLKYYNYSVVATMKQYNHFGEIALQKLITRTATVITKVECIFAVLSYEIYQQLLEDLRKESVVNYFHIVQRVFPFNLIQDDEILMELMTKWECRDYKINEFIYTTKYNNIADSIYLILEGEIQIQFENYACIYGQEQVIGEYEQFINSYRRKSKAITKCQTKILQIQYNPLIDILKQSDNYQDYLEYLNRKCKDKFKINNLFKNEQRKSNPILSNEMIKTKKEYLSIFKFTNPRLQKLSIQLNSIQQSFNHPVLKNCNQSKNTTTQINNNISIDQKQFKIKTYVNKLKKEVRINRILTQISDDSIRNSNGFQINSYRKLGF